MNSKEFHWFSQEAPKSRKKHHSERKASDKERKASIKGTRMTKRKGTEIKRVYSTKDEYQVT
jgi:hypothetical protein